MKSIASDKKKVLIFWGGWEGHEPELVAKRFANIMTKNGYDVAIFNSQEILLDKEYVTSMDLIIPCWTMGSISEEACRNISEAVAAGTGLAGCHGGMCDAFRENVEWQFMTGGQWVAHPGNDGIEYTVNIHHGSSQIVEGLNDFSVCSEQYYLHIDPAIEVVASTRFPVFPYFHDTNKAVSMPVAWTKFWGKGRVFYNALGHHDDIFEKFKEAEILMERGMIWAAEGTK